MENPLKNITRALNIASDWRFADKKITLGKKTLNRSEAVSMMAKLDLQTQQLTKKAIGDWRIANQLAIDVDNPVRYPLYSIYDDAMHDLHLKGAVRNRKLAVLGTPFKLVNDKGETDRDASHLLRMKWMREFMSLAMDSRFYGHSLIQFGDIRRDGKMKFNEVELIPRHHVSPEYGTLLKYYYDDPRNGIPYRDTELMDWAIEVGGKKDLGELNSTSKETISKKFVLQFWDNFAEIFGMPIRMAKTSSRDSKDRAKIENMLEQMGSAAWGLFPEGTSLELIGSSQSDAYEVYDRRVDRANSEISKGILGQTMTMDDGSSQSQAKVHAEVANEISDADRTFMYDLINDDLLPFLVKHGWPVDKLTFDWDETYDYSPSEMKDIEEMILEHYDVDPAYFEDKYGIKITAKKVAELGTQKKNLGKKTFPSWLEDLIIQEG